MEVGGGCLFVFGGSRMVKSFTGEESVGGPTEAMHRQLCIDMFVVVLTVLVFIIVTMIIAFFFFLTV